MAGLGGSTGASGAIRAGRAYVEAYLDSNRLDRGLKAIQSRFQKVGSFLQQLGTQTFLAGAGLAAPLAAATAVFVGFDDAIRMARAAVGASETEFARLVDLAKQLGRTTSFSATEVANLMVELGRAGFSVPEIENMTKAVLDMARAAGVTAPEAAGIMSATIRQFGLDAKDAAHVADMLTATANKSFSTLQGIGETLQYAGPVAKDLGLSLTDTLALVGALGNVGIQGSEAGTALRRLGIIAASEPEKFAAIGVATKDAGGNLRDLVDILDDVFRATQAMGNADRAKVFNDLFGLLGITSASALSRNTKGVRELREEIARSGGIAADTAREMDAGVGGAWRRFKSSVEAIAIAVGDALAPALMEIGQHLQLVANTIITFVNQNREVITTVGKVAIGLMAAGAALIALGLTAKVTALGIAGLLGVLGLVKAAVLFLLSPVGLVTAAVVGLVAAWATMTDSGKETVSQLKRLFGDLGDTATKTWGGIVDALKAGNLQLAAEVATAGMKLAWAQAMQFLTQKWTEFKGFIMRGWMDIRDYVADLLLVLPTLWVHGTEGEAAARRFVQGIDREMQEMRRAEERDLAAGQDASVAAARRAVEEARARLAAATDQAARERAAKELADRQRDAERAAADERAIRGSALAPAKVAAAVSGGFASPDLGRQFGYSSDTFQKRALTAQEDTARNTREAARQLGTLLLQMRFQ